MGAISRGIKRIFNSKGNMTTHSFLSATSNSFRSSYTNLLNFAPGINSTLTPPHSVFYLFLQILIAVPLLIAHRILNILISIATYILVAILATSIPLFAYHIFYKQLPMVAYFLSNIDRYKYTKDIPPNYLLYIILLILCITAFVTITLIAKKFYFFLTEEDKNNKSIFSPDPFHDDITTKVYRRLILRNAVLKEVEDFACHSNEHFVSTGEYNTKDNKLWKTTKNSTNIGLFNLQFTKTNTDETTISESYPTESILKAEENDHIPPHTRAYNLAVTDLFVEKALVYLNRKARLYSRQGFFLITVSFISIIAGAITAFISLKYPETSRLTLSNSTTLNWQHIITSFTKSFTFYGLIILIAVYAGRMGKALFDQAERMKDRRHALRQGRLYVHLNGGKLTIDELDKAFNWNTSQSNAFFHFNPEAQAPWGNMFKEMMITLRETAKSSMELAKSAKKSD